MELPSTEMGKTVCVAGLSKAICSQHRFIFPLVFLIFSYCSKLVRFKSPFWLSVHHIFCLINLFWARNFHYTPLKLCVETLPTPWYRHLVFFRYFSFSFLIEIICLYMVMRLCLLWVWNFFIQVFSSYMKYKVSVLIGGIFLCSSP